jgi:YggT family protein
MILAALTRGDVADYVGDLFWVYSLLILAYILWLIRVFEFLRDIAEPLFAPFRRIIPSFGAFDLSPLVALIVLRIVAAIVVGIIRG